MALGTQVIDAAGFTIVRLFSGAVVMLLLVTAMSSRGARTGSRGSWAGAAALFAYAITFSYAYVSLDTGSGALILFAAVQFSMIVLTLILGDRLSLMEWSGAAAAFSGFVYLVLPGASAPSFSGFVLMSLAGVAWGISPLTLIWSM